MALFTASEGGLQGTREKARSVPRGARGRLPKTATFVIGPLLGAVFGWLAFRGIAWGEVWRSLTGFSYPYGLLALAVVLVVAVLRAYRWWLLFPSGERVNLVRLFWVQNVGSGINNVLPVRIAAEPFMFGFLTLRYKLNAGAVFTTLVAERVQDSLATGALLLVGLLFLPHMAILRVFLAVAGGVTLLHLVILLFFSQRAIGLPVLSRFRFVQSVAHSISELGQNKLGLTGSTGVTVFNWVLACFGAWLIAVGLGLKVPFLHIVTAVIITTYSASFIPGLPAALGTWEFFGAYVLALLGVPKEMAVGFALLTHVLYYLPAMALALAFLVREGNTLRGIPELIRRWRSAAGRPQGPS